MTKIYISGPISNPDPEQVKRNIAVFHKAAADLRARGMDVVNPVEFGEEPGMEWADYMRKDIKALMDCTAVATLPGWKKSKGARLEVYISLQLGLKVDPFWLVSLQASVDGFGAAVKRMAKLGA